MQNFKRFNWLKSCPRRYVPKAFSLRRYFSRKKKFECIHKEKSSNSVHYRNYFSGIVVIRKSKDLPRSSLISNPPVLFSCVHFIFASLTLVRRVWSRFLPDLRKRLSFRFGYVCPPFIQSFPSVHGKQPSVSISPSSSGS